MRLWTTRFQRRALLAMVGAAVIAVIIDCGDTNTPPQKSNGITKVTVSAAATGIETPLDATPDPMGVQIFFLAGSATGPGVYQVAAAGGKPTLLYSGAPLVGPRGISTSSDGKTLYIADPAAGTDGKGLIFSMPSSGNTPAPVAGTEGTRPTALDLAENGTADDIYFAGQDANGDPEVFVLKAKSTTATSLLKGAPLAKPDGIAVATDGTVYIADAQAGMAQPGQAYKLATSGKVTALGPELKPGSPMGTAVTLDDGALLVSSLDPKAGTSQVEILQTADGSASAFNDVIKQNTVSGGLHRARFKDVYAWAGKTQVYYIKIGKILADSSTPGGVGVN